MEIKEDFEKLGQVHMISIARMFNVVADMTTSVVIESECNALK